MQITVSKFSARRAAPTPRRSDTAQSHARSERDRYILLTGRDSCHDAGVTEVTHTHTVPTLTMQITRCDARVLSELWAGRFPTVYTVRGRGGGLRLCILLFSSAGVAQAASTAALYKRLKASIREAVFLHSLCHLEMRWPMRCQQHTPSRTQYMATARILYVILHSTTVPNKTSHAPRACMYV
jgi:hypothetical protein